MGAAPVRDYFDSIAPVYDDFAAQYVAHHEKLAAAVARHLPLGGARVLDLACGTGMSSAPYLARGARVVGVDASAGMLQLAAKQPFARLICGDLLESSLDELESASFDLALSVGALEFLPEPAALLRRAAARWLRQRGLFATLVALNAPEKLAPGTPPFRVFTRAGAREMATSAGFRIIEEVDGMAFMTPRTLTRIELFAFVAARP